MQLSEVAVELNSQSKDAMNRIHSSIFKTPCLPSRLKLPSSTKLWLKTENFQYTGSFKLRGAMSKLTNLEKDAPVITASSGNHGIACSLAAMTTGHKLTVVLPENVSKAKLAKIESYGTKTLLHAGDSGQAEKHARSLAKNNDYVYVSPYNDSLIIAGQGTIGLELTQQIPQIDNIFISMGGGGLISGVGSVIKTFSPKTNIIGVSAVNSAALAASMQAGKIVTTEHKETLADGCAGGVDENSLTLPIAMEVVDRVIYCSEKQIENALQILAWDEKILVEGAAAMALAAFLSEKESFFGKCNVILLCGGNFDRDVIWPIIKKT